MYEFIDCGELSPLIFFHWGNGRDCLFYSGSVLWVSVHVWIDTAFYIVHGADANTVLDVCNLSKPCSRL